MNNFGEYLTPERAHELSPDISVSSWYRMAQLPPQTCQNCDAAVWKWGASGLCFSCTTGEADASGDYELEQL